MSRIHQSFKRAHAGKSIFDLDANGNDVATTRLDSRSQLIAASIPNLNSQSAEGVRFRSVPLHIPPGLPLMPFQDSEPEAAEQYRILRTNIRQHPDAPKVIAISSPMPGDGKTVTAINVSAVLALKEDSRVLLIDGDLRQRTVGCALGLDFQHGLSDVIAGACNVDDAIVQTDRIPNLHVLTAGAVRANPAELLDSDAFRALVRALRSEFSYIIFDTTPIAIVADYQLVQQVCDGSILVVRPDFTDRSQFLKSLEVEPRRKLLGVVINAFQEWLFYKQSGGYYYRRPAETAATGGV